jgi:hypothetical protein
MSLENRKKTLYKVSIYLITAFQPVHEEPPEQSLISLNRENTMCMIA